MTNPTGSARTATGQAPQPSSGWQVWPGQVTAFAQAVHQVREEVASVFQQLDQFTSPGYQVQMDSSPVGHALTAKFLDRLAGGEGLLAHLEVVLTHLDQFVQNAEQSASRYQEADQSSASGLAAPK